MSTSGAFGAYDVKQLFHLVEAAHSNLAQTHAQIQAWQRAEQMLRGHHDNLVAYRNNLTAQWPPEQNAASAAYLQKLDELTAAVTKTADAVATNRGLLEQVATGIEQQMAPKATDGRPTLKQLYDEYVANEKKLATYQAQLNAAQAAGGAIGDATGHVAGSVAAGGSSLLGDAFGKVGSALLGGAAKAGMQLVTDPPVPDGRQDQLNQQARDAYVTLSGTAQDAAGHMQTPPPYQPPQLAHVDPGKHLGGGSAGGAIQPPAIAPPAHTRAASAPGATVPGETGTPASPGATPVLSGGRAGTLPAPTSGTATGGPAPGGDTGTVPGLLVGLLPLAGAPLVTGDGQPPVRRGGIGEPGVQAERLSRPAVKQALRPGGVIGEGEPGLGAVERGTTGVRRANPVGGVIGETEPGPGAIERGATRARPTGGVLGEGAPGVGAGGGRGPAAGRGPSGRIGGTRGAGVAGEGEVGPGILGGQRRNRRADDDEHAWDPDNPWQVGDGVAPVILPGEEPRVHDAGSGVLGIDR